MARKQRGKYNDTTKVMESCHRQEYNLIHDPFIGISLIIVIAFIAYFNTVNAPFVFDDYPYLRENPLVRSFHYFLNQDQVFKLAIDIDVKNSFILRPFSYFTFALNFALHGYDVRGYHVVNLLLHIGNAICVFLLLSLTLQATAMNTPGHDRQGSSSLNSIFPLVCALIFVTHPLQTQAVTYIIQRFTTLASLLCLLSLVTYILSRRAERAAMRRIWYVLCLVATILAMHSKENAFTMPVVIAMYEFIFLTGKLAKRVAGLIPVIATMGIIPYKLLQLSTLTRNTAQTDLVAAINSVNFKETSSGDYLMTQFGVVVSYLRLLFVPIRQNLLHDLPLQHSFFSFKVLGPLALIICIIAIGIWALKCSKGNHSANSTRLKIVAFGIFWFFVTLAVESSIIPIDDPMFEHRVYLPSVGLIMAVLAGGDIFMVRARNVSLFSSKAASVGICLLVSCAAVATVERNKTWGNEITLWTDVIRKNPNSSRAHNALGVALARQEEVQMKHLLAPKSENMVSVPFLGSKTRQSQLDAAIKEFRHAIELDPIHEKAQINLGIALIDRGKFDDALTALQRATRLETRRYPSLHYFHMGRAYTEKGDYDRATEAFTRAIELDPRHSSAFEHLGDVHAVKQRWSEALAAYENAYKLSPEETLYKKIIALQNRL